MNENVKSKNKVAGYKNMSLSRKIAFGAVFTSLALVLSIMENFIPLGAVIPVPGVKMGLANIVTVFAIVALSPKEAFFIVAVRCAVTGLFTGPVYFLFSITGGMLALAIMWVLLPGLGRVFSVTGISIAGAALHNTGQVIVAAFLLQDTAILFFYLPLLLFVSLFTGALTGLVATPVIKNVSDVL